MNIDSLVSVVTVGSIYLTIVGLMDLAIGYMWKKKMDKSTILFKEVKDETVL